VQRALNVATRSRRNANGEEETWCALRRRRALVGHTPSCNLIRLYRGPQVNGIDRRTYGFYCQPKRDLRYGERGHLLAGVPMTC
jgi:hypothetical protein